MAQRSELPDDLPKTASAVEAIADLARKAAEAQVLSIPTGGLGDGLPPAVPVLFNSRSGAVVSLKSSIEEFRQQPHARQGVATVTTLASFIELMNRHKGDDSAIFAQTKWPNLKLTGVVDYHGLNHEPAHGRHRVRYQFPITDEMTAWIANSGMAMPQAEFAAFLEEHAAELASPFEGESQEYELLFKEKVGSPTDIISLSRELEIFVGQKVKNKTRLQSGEQSIEFVEEHTDAKGKKVVIPGAFIVSVQAFVDGEKVRIPARLRYRVKGSDILWFYQLYRWEFWLREQVQNDLEKVVGGTGLPAFEGVDEAGNREGGL
ncbi:DUF2303 family protein [Hansschlegelia zhihuaiae]|uniref:DUF2303 family protein n=1 Tax=Hansschlegelia zhihuaiae TaxID=405005 RepID=A0A4V1KIW2_9HYPH|nr:DUF2303 family protein [Hansschlegelia zhihuaiae]RXF72082.1 DUF2303 family protein [Hansschlegelia zhihuaiae]